MGGLKFEGAPKIIARETTPENQILIYARNSLVQKLSSGVDISKSEASKRVINVSAALLSTTDSVTELPPWGGPPPVTVSEPMPMHGKEKVYCRKNSECASNGLFYGLLYAREERLWIVVMSVSTSRDE